MLVQGTEWSVFVLTNILEQTSTRAHGTPHTKKEADTKRPTFYKRDTKKDTQGKRHTHAHRERDIGRDTERERRRQTHREREQNTHTHQMIEIDRMTGGEMHTEKYLQRKKHKQKERDTGRKTLS